MARCICPECGREIRYVVAAASLGNNGIILVDHEEREIITEKGRKVRGYQEHKCRLENGSNRNRPD
jgi:hypothetical protein